MNTIAKFTVLTISLFLTLLVVGCNTGMDCGPFPKPPMLDKPRFYGDTISRTFTSNELLKFSQDYNGQIISILVRNPIGFGDSVYKRGIQVIEDSTLESTIVTSIIVRSTEPGTNTYPVRDSLMNGQYVVWVSHKNFIPSSIQQNSTKGATLQCSPPLYLTHFLESAVVRIPRGMRFSASYRRY
jgi:hypothetical protein